MNRWIANNVIYRLIELTRGERVHEYFSRIKDIPWLSSEEIRDIQRKKLKNALENAYKNIPYYHDAFDQAGIDPKLLNLPEDMNKIPILDKEVVQANPERLKNRNSSRWQRVSKEVTSGTSGHPVTVLKDRRKSSFIRAVMFRCYHQYGISIGEKQARFWSTPIGKMPYLRQKFEDFLLNRIRLSAFDTRDKSLHEFTRRLRSFNPRYFYGYASLIYKYSQWLDERKISLNGINPSIIITTAEVLYDFQRRLIERVFKCRVANEYGSTEAGVLAFECPNGNFHVNSDHIFLETVGKPGDPGSVLLTELNNDYSPLIRYRLGDMGVMSSANCGCGINFPVITNLIGRENSFIVTPKDEYIFDGVLHYVLTNGIKQFRAIQDNKEELVIKIVKNDEWTGFLQETCRKRLQGVLGDDLKITFELVAEIEPDKSGKLRPFISNIKSEKLEPPTNVKRKWISAEANK